MDNQETPTSFQAEKVDDFRITAMLADYVSLKNGLLYVLGGGVGRVTVPHGTPAPYTVSNLGIGAIISVPWSKTLTEHTFSVRLVDEDAQSIFLPTGDGSVVPARADFPVVVNRPDEITPGMEQQYPLAINFPNSTFPKLGVYVFLLLINDVEYDRVVMNVVELKQ